MHGPHQRAPEQQPWQDAKRGQNGDYRIGGRKRAQARQKRAPTETRRTRIQKAEDCDRGAEQYGWATDGSEGDSRQDQESNRNARDLWPANAPPGKDVCRPPRVTTIAAVSSPIIEDKDVGR